MTFRDATRIVVVRSGSDVEYENRAVIVADSITSADGRELVGDSALPAGSGEPDTTARGRGE